MDIVIQGNHIVTLTMAQTTQNSRVLAKIPSQINSAGSGILFDYLSYDLPAIIITAIIHEEDLIFT
jgi:hypothetical protein